MKTEELIENYLVYTDNGIEKVHWCNVNGVKELVSPKGKVYGYVPDYFEVKRLQEQLDIVTEQRNDIHIDKQVLQKQLNEANRIIKKLYKESGNPIGIDYIEKLGVK